MSKFNLTKTVLATALAVVLVPTTASAARVALGGHTKHAFEVTNLTGTNHPEADLNASFQYILEAGDILVGRSTGNINVRVTLTGAEFEAVPSIVITQGTIVGTASFATNVLSFVIAPPSAPGFTATELFNITAPSLATIKATNLNTLGSNVQASVDVRDTGTGTTLQSAANGSILIATQASKITLAASVDTTANVAGGKKTFTVAGGASDSRTVKLAGITTAAQADTTNTTTLVSAAGSTQADNIEAGVLNFQFDANGAASITPSLRDRLGVRVNFADTTGFTHVFVTTGTTCPTVVGLATPVNVAGTTAVLTLTGNQYAGEIDLSNASTESFSVCGRTNGTDVIGKQDVTTSANYNFLTARDTAFSTAVKTAGLVYDGSSQDVDFFNPSTNVNQQSFLRISNASTNTGLVTISGRCDNGTSVTNGTLTLAAQNSVLLTAQALAAGTGMTTALGTCSAGGKLRLNVTGEFSPMKVQNFVKSVTASGEITTNYNDEK